MIVEVSDINAETTNLSDLFLLDTNVLIPIFLDKKSDIKEYSKYNPEAFECQAKIVNAIRDGVVKDCVICDAVKYQLYDLSKSGKFKIENFLQWYDSLKEGERNLLYEFRIERKDLKNYVQAFNCYNCSEGDKMFLASLIVTGISCGVSDDNDMYTLQARA